MGVTCPACGQGGMSALEALGASVRSPARCPRCGALIAHRPHPAAYWLAQLAFQLVFWGGVAAALLVGSWWPFLVGTLLAAVVLPGVLAWFSPLAMVDEAQVRRSRWVRTAFVVVFVLVAILGALGAI